MADDDHLLIPGLPDDISLQCIARLPISSHPTLSHVSRSWRSLLLSPSLFAVRSLLPLSHPVLALSIRSPSGPSTWHLLTPRRHFPLPSPPLPTVGSTAVPLGPLLFLLGGSHRGVATPSLQIYDSRLRRWSRGPRMSSAREFSAAGSVSGRIYAVGGCLPSAASWAESLLDPAGSHPRWAPLPSPFPLRAKWMHGSAVLSGKLLAAADRGGIVFNPAADPSWGPLPLPLDLEWRGRAAAVGRVLYTYDCSGRIRGFDWASGEWMRVEGLETELPRFLCGATLADFGGLLCLVWEGKGRDRSWETEISCAAVDVSRAEGGGLKGSVVWMESAVLNVPKGSSVSHCITLEM